MLLPSRIAASLRMTRLTVIGQRRCKSSAAMTIGSSNMLADAYRNHSKNQYSVHDGCLDMLEASIERMSHRFKAEPSLHLADLGPADGSNSMMTLQRCLDVLKGQGNKSIHVTFEEHPQSDEEALRSVLKENNDWFRENQMTHSILMKSFYEPLFEKESVHQFLSYLCLHWLDTADGSNKWKNFVNTVDTTKFTTINEMQTPSVLRKVWKERLALRHLANFLYLRSQELKSGGEGVFVMVADPHEFAQPPSGEESPLTQAMRRNVSNGTLREQVLMNSMLPVYLRRKQDVLDSFELANERSDGELELMDLRYYSVPTKHTKESSAVELYWSIHVGAVRAAGLTTEEEKELKATCREVFDHEFSQSTEDGINGHFLALVVRKK